MASILTNWGSSMAYLRLYPILLDVGGGPAQIRCAGHPFSVSAYGLEIDCIFPQSSYYPMT